MRTRQEKQEWWLHCYRHINRVQNGGVSPAPGALALLWSWTGWIQLGRTSRVQLFEWRHETWMLFVLVVFLLVEFCLFSFALGKLWAGSRFSPCIFCLAFPEMNPDLEYVWGAMGLFQVSGRGRGLCYPREHLCTLPAPLLPGQDQDSVEHLHRGLPFPLIIRIAVISNIHSILSTMTGLHK